jgi:hypothetical protein
VQALLHGVAIAAFDILEIPVWGRLDDAADRVAAYIMLQFGETVAWNTIVGFAWFLSGNALVPPDFTDARRLAIQRYYTTVCIALGGERRGVYKLATQYKGFLNFDGSSGAGDLPRDRAAGCHEEFDTTRQAFDAAIMPYVDRGLLEQVRKMAWIKFGSGK